MPEPDPSILAIESALQSLNDDGRDRKQIYSEIATSLHKLARLSSEPTTSLPATLKAIATKQERDTIRPLALVLIRLASHPELPLNNYRSCRHHIVHLIRKGCPDLVRDIWNNQKLQNHELIDRLQEIHNQTCNRLTSLQHPFTTLDQVNSLRETIMRHIRNKMTKSYLQIFDFNSIELSVTSLLTHVDTLTQSQGPHLQTSLDSLLESVDEKITQYQSSPVFIVREYFIHFLKHLKDATQDFQNTLSENFACDLQTPSPTYTAERRYPLNIVGYEIHFAVPLTNTGPGVAQNVRAYCLADHCHVKREELRLGDVEPSSFVLDLIVVVTEPRDKLDLEIEIQWSAVGNPNDGCKSFTVSILSQRTNIDWEDLSRRHPYSLDVVEAREFHGRSDTVRRILGRLAPDSMRSCYITGQKRVGKSSLARKIESDLQQRTSDSYHVLFLDCGDIMHTTGERTLAALGTELEEFLVSSTPLSLNWESRDYSSSLGPLSRLMNTIRRLSISSNFVVILDEFDEINESLYRFGELASTFFLNLRSLSSRRNLAFVLIGAERMPYVMASQGEKLNKFERESLDSFNLETEWADYVALVRDPIHGLVEFHESAVRKLFELTDGHPYFTKMLCVDLYNYLVESKDAEVTASEVDVVQRRVIQKLDINAFAHYLRDGVRGNEDEREIVATDRSRLLRSWVRCVRANQPRTIEALQESGRSSSLDPSKVAPLLDDFCRRRVFVETRGTYNPKVQLFSFWLKEHGISQLILDPLGDELALAKQSREAAAYVTSNEIVELVEKWDIYLSRKVKEERVRAWIEQVESIDDQRLLFTMLTHVRFIGLEDAQQMFEGAHAWMRRKLPVPVKRRRSERRSDIFVSYVDGAGKSGAECARIYARVNEIVLQNVIAPQEIQSRFEDVDEGNFVGLVIVDDFIGTGDTLEGGLGQLSVCFDRFEIGAKHPLLVVALCGTVEGESRVRSHIGQSMTNADLYLCDLLGPQHYAFHENNCIWQSLTEMDLARTLVTDLGGRIQPRNPLGYNSQGLLLTLWRNCPNNSLPILHSEGKRSTPWVPLFQRIR